MPLPLRAPPGEEAAAVGTPREQWEHTDPVFLKKIQPTLTAVSVARCGRGLRHDLGVHVTTHESCGGVCSLFPLRRHRLCFSVRPSGFYAPQ